MRNPPIMAEHGKVIAGGLVLLVLGVAVGFFAGGSLTDNQIGARPPTGGAPGGGGDGGSVTQRMELRDIFGVLIPCGTTLSNRGDVVLTGYATSTAAKTQEFRSGYGVNGGNEAWYSNHTATLPAGVETLIVHEVQDIDVGVTSATFTLNSIGNTKTKCTIGVSNVLNPSEGAISERSLITGALVDEVRIDAFEYATGAPITCGDVTTDHLSRVRYKVMFLSDVGVWASWHTHVENPGKTGPDQNADGLNNRWWEITTPQLKFVPANTWTQMVEVTTAGNPGVNVLHAGEVSSDGTKVETFCSYRV